MCSHGATLITVLVLVFRSSQCPACAVFDGSNLFLVIVCIRLIMERDAPIVEVES